MTGILNLEAMAEKKKEQRYHNGMPVDSDEEVLCLMWLEELMEAGYIIKIERAPTFSLFDGLTNVYETEKQLKTKVKSVEHRQVLLATHEYTPEFRITWAPKAVGVLIWKFYRDVNEKFNKLFVYTQHVEAPISYIEVKPEFDQNNMTRAFRINQKWMYEKHELFVNLVLPSKLCEDTFTPAAWFVTRAGKKRAIHWPVKTVEEYLESLKSQDEPGRECTKADSGETEG